MSRKVALLFIGMTMAESAQVGLLIMSKVAISNGMTTFIFVFYSYALASLVLLPLSLLFQYWSNRPPLSFSFVCQVFLLALIGYLASTARYAGVNLSSPTLSASMHNLVPGLIFILAALFGLEKLDVRASSTVAKSVGTMVSIGGAFVMTYYRGPPIVTVPSNSSRLLLQLSNWTVGGLFLAVDAILTSAWFIVQALILKKYHAEMILVFFYCFFGSVLSGVVCFIVESDLSAWSLIPSIRSIAILYAGVFGYAFRDGEISWSLRQTGPVFVSMFKPLGIVLAAAFGVVFLGDTLYLGSLVGATVIVVGFYAVMCGKSKEQNVVVEAGIIDDSSSQSQEDQVPLLQSHSEEIKAHN